MWISVSRNTGFEALGWYKKLPDEEVAPTQPDDENAVENKKRKLDGSKGVAEQKLYAQSGDKTIKLRLKWDAPWEDTVRTAVLVRAIAIIGETSSDLEVDEKIDFKKWQVWCKATPRDQPVVRAVIKPGDAANKSECVLQWNLENLRVAASTDKEGAEKLLETLKEGILKSQKQRDEQLQAAEQGWCG